MRRYLLVLSCALGAGCPRDRQNAQAQERLKDALERVRIESRRHYSAETLPSRQQLQQAAEAETGEAWRHLAPAERFFVFEVSPKIRSAAGTATVAEAYCAALGTIGSHAVAISHCGRIAALK